MAQHYIEVRERKEGPASPLFAGATTNTKGMSMNVAEVEQALLAVDERDGAAVIHRGLPSFEAGEARGPEACEEIRDSAFCYGDREKGLGEDLTHAIDETIARISDLPRSMAVFSGWVDTPTVHSTAVTQFPCRVPDYLTDTRFVILAYAHSRRKPRYWEPRIDH